jgi:hypothetical protein
VVSGIWSGWTVPLQNDKLNRRTNWQYALIRSELAVKGPLHLCTLKALQWTFSVYTISNRLKFGAIALMVSLHRNSSVVDSRAGHGVVRTPPRSRTLEAVAGSVLRISWSRMDGAWMWIHIVRTLAVFRCTIPVTVRQNRSALTSQERCNKEQ